jgi:sigma-B regulation protein RsbU (phosphoserine phosphatase)
LFAQSSLAKSRSTGDAAAHIQRIREALAPLGALDALSICLKAPEGNILPVFGGDGAGIEENVACIESDDGEYRIAGAKNNQVGVKLLEAVVRATLHAIEVEKREELLLDELSANWESLEALYEISTDILRSDDIKDGLKRLLGRLVSLQDGLQAALFLGRNGRFEPVVSTLPGVSTVEANSLGQIARVLDRDRQVIILNDLCLLPDPPEFLRGAAHMAAAPITSGQETIGFVAAWRNDNLHEFDSPLLHLLEAITFQGSMLMESDRLNRKVRESELLAKEIEIASSIQQTLLLANAPRDVPDLEIAACSVPSQYIDGDFYDFFQHPNGTVDVFVGDVMGKGVAAALLGAATKSQLLRSLANLALRSGEGVPRPVDVVRRAASRVGEQLILLERFVTLYYARFDSVSKQFHYVDCGHTATMLARKSTRESLFLQGDDLPLGVVEKSNFQQHSIGYRPGDTFLLYSDGVTENRSLEGEFFGTERLAECLENWSSLGPAILVQQIRKEATRFNGSNRFSDDFTCIAVRIRIPPPAVEPTRQTENFACDVAELGRFREWLRQSGDNGLDEADAYRMELACTELFANCAAHGGQLSGHRPISVESIRYPDHVTVRLRHRGLEFDPLSIPPPSFDGSRDNGFGTYIVLRSADEACYERDADGTNVITVTFCRTTAS